MDRSLYNIIVYDDFFLFYVFEIFFFLQPMGLTSLVSFRKVEQLGRGKTKQNKEKENRNKEFFSVKSQKSNEVSL